MAGAANLAENRPVLIYMDRQDEQDFVCLHRTVIDGQYRSRQIQKSCPSMFESATP